jgi:hypothetical protein
VVRAQELPGRQLVDGCAGLLRAELGPEPEHAGLEPVGVLRVELEGRIRDVHAVHERIIDVDGPGGTDVWGAFAWCIGLIVVFAGLSVHRYRRAVSS